MVDSTRLLEQPFISDLKMELKMKNNEQKINYKAFIPVGITFIGSGVTFMIVVNSMIGAGLIGVGVAFIISGVKRTQNNNKSS